MTGPGGDPTDDFAPYDDDPGPSLPPGFREYDARHPEAWAAYSGIDYGLLLVSMASILPREVDWLWPGYIAKGGITIVQGDPGIGKSWLSLALAAAITRGWALPGCEPLQPAKVLVLSAEDDPGYTIRPRLDKLGADPQKVELIRAVYKDDGSQRPVSLAEDLYRVEGILQRGGYGLFIIDPLNAYLGTVLDTHRDAAVRSVLAPVATLAEKFGIGVECVSHLTKGGRERSIYRGQGSIAYVAQARIVLLVGKDPDLADRRHLVCIKNNLAKTPPSLAFDLAPAFGWAGESPYSDADLLRPDPTPEEKQDVIEARESLEDVLGSGPLESRKVFTALRKRQIKDTLVKRAKDDLLRQGRLRVAKEGFGPSVDWVWELVVPETPSANGSGLVQAKLGIESE